MGDFNWGENSSGEEDEPRENEKLMAALSSAELDIEEALIHAERPGDIRELVRIHWKLVSLYKEADIDE